MVLVLKPSHRIGHQLKLVMQDEIEVDLYESGGSDKEPSPPGSALPTYMSGHQSKIEEASCKRKRILEGGQQSTDVQDLTGNIMYPLHIRPCSV